MSHTRLVIDLGHQLPLVIDVLLTEGNLPTWISGFRKARGDFNRHWTEQRRINAIVHKGRPQRDYSAGITSRRRECRKVASQHRGRWNELPHVGRILA